MNKDPIIDAAEEAKLLAEQAEEEAGVNIDDDGAGDDAAPPAGDPPAAKTDEKPADDSAAPPKAEDPPAEAPPAAAQRPVLSLEADDTAAKAQLEALTRQRADLRKKYSDGDLSREEYETQTDSLTDQIIDAKSAIARAETYRDITAKAARQQWEDAVDAFMGDEANAAFRDGGVLNVALDAQIRKMHADAAVLARFPNHARRLEEAKRIVLEDARKALGVAAPAAPAKAAAPAAAKKQAVQPPPSVDDIPPAADERESEFAHLDRLSPAQREAAIAKLTPEQLDRYLAEA